MKEKRDQHAANASHLAELHKLEIEEKKIDNEIKQRILREKDLDISIKETQLAILKHQLHQTSSATTEI
jgi:hypothetical protein